MFDNYIYICFICKYHFFFILHYVEQKLLIYFALYTRIVLIIICCKSTTQIESIGRVRNILYLLYLENSYYILIKTFYKHNNIIIPMLERDFVIIRFSFSWKYNSQPRQNDYRNWLCKSLQRPKCMNCIWNIFS